jgi:lysyl-tRNA synthetase class 2
LRLIDETIDLVQVALALVGRTATVRKISFRDLYLEQLDIDPLLATLDELRNAGSGININGAGLSRDDWLDLLMTHRLQPSFPPGQLLAAYDWPASQCALAKIRHDETPVAERFELYLGQLELANGYHELNNASEQRQRFERDQSVRLQRGDSVPPMDEHLLASLSSLPDCAGVALGIDRLLMAMLDTQRIADVLAFDFARA